MDRPNETKESTRSCGTFARVLATLLLIGLIVAIGAGVYNAGVSAGLAQTVAAPSGAPVAYYPGPYVWHGWGWGFGILRDLLLDPGDLPRSSACCGPSSAGADGVAAATGTGITGRTATAARGSTSTTGTVGRMSRARQGANRRPRAARPMRAGGDARPSTMRPMARILVVDDEPKIVQLVRDYLEHGGFEVLTARDGREALMRARRERPDLVVLDLGLPEVDGLDVTRALRREADVPLIMLTARDSETDKIVGLELGADDYLTKPFSPRELVARVRAVLRRHARDGSEEQITVGDLTLDVPRLQATVAGQRVALTATEFELLATMARQPGRVFTRSQLLDAIHGQALESYERAIDAHVKNIRRKVEPDPRHPQYLLTVYGVGYRVADA